MHCTLVVDCVWLIAVGEDCSCVNLFAVAELILRTSFAACLAFRIACMNAHHKKEDLRKHAYAVKTSPIIVPIIYGKSRSDLIDTAKIIISPL